MPYRRGSQRKRQPPAPGLRHLPPDLRPDARAGELGERRGGCDQRGRLRRGLAAEAEPSPQHRQAAKQRGAAGERTEGERGAGGQEQAAAALPRRAGERVHHREAARRPRAGHAGEHGGRPERDLEVAQHGTSVW